MNASVATIPEPSTSSLRERLPRYSADAAALLRELFSKPRRWTLGGAGSSFWFEPRMPSAMSLGERVGVTIGGRPGELSITSGTLDPVGELDWSDYAGNARLTAWTLAHRRPMTRLARIFDSATLPQALLDADSDIAPGLVAIGFAIGDDNGTSDEGVLHIEPAVLRHLLASAHDNPETRGNRAALDHLPASLKLSAMGPELALNELRALERGDVLVLGDRRSAFGQLHLAPNEDDSRGWTASWNDGRVRIDATASWTIDESWRTPMNDTSGITPEPDSETPATAADPLAQLPVRIAFTLGETSIPLAELSAFEPGYVFELGSQVEHARIGIRANGKHVGHGRLVAIGETLGVQLEGWEIDGLQ